MRQKVPSGMLLYSQQANPVTAVAKSHLKLTLLRN